MGLFDTAALVFSCCCILVEMVGFGPVLFEFVYLCSGLVGFAAMGFSGVYTLDGIDSSGASDASSALESLASLGLSS